MAKSAIAEFVPSIKMQGKYVGKQGRMPAHWLHQVGEVNMCLSEDLLRLPTDASSSTLLDIWKTGSGKFLSVSWMPGRPEQPLHISSFKGTELQALLDSVAVG